jgi:hypothetical protein
MRFIRADLEDGSPWPLGEERFQGIVVANYLHRPLFARIAQALAPGGVLIYETFMQGNERYGKPSNPAFLLEPGELWPRSAVCTSSPSSRGARRGRARHGAADLRRAPGKRIKSRSTAPQGATPMITGSLVAIVTPMQPDGRLDMARFRELIDWHVAEGTDGIVVVGTTGESPTVDFDEHKELIRVAVDHAKGRIPVIAGTGGNSTAEAIELTESAKKAGATACLSVVPYYNKPTQEGLYQHFRKVAETVEPADDPLQRAGAHGRRPAERHGDAPRAGARHHRHQGRHREHRARHRPREARAARLRRLQRRGRHRARPHPPRRAGRDLGHRERRAAPDARDVRRRAGRRREEGARHQPAPARPAPEAVRRGEPDSR